MKRILFIIAIIIGIFSVPDFSSNLCYAQSTSTFTKNFYGAMGGKQVTFQLTFPKNLSPNMKVSGYFWYNNNKAAKVRIAGNMTNNGLLMLYKYQDRNKSTGDYWILSLDFDDMYAYLEGEMQPTKGKSVKVFCVANM